MALEDELRVPEFEWLIRKVRKRVEAGRNVEKGALSLKGLTAAQRTALAKLTGLREVCNERQGSIGYDKIDGVLREGTGEGLRAAIERTVGEPFVDRHALRRHESEAWTDLFAELRFTPELSREDASWLDEVEEQRRLKRRSRSDRDRVRDLVQRLAKVAALLPAADVPIAILAGQLGGSHALDRGQAVGDLAARFIAWRHQLPADLEWRDIWERVGVLCDDISTPALVLNLRAEGDGVAAATLALHADAGEPARLSARVLKKRTHGFTRNTTGNRVFVCENPSVVAAAADTHGANCAPLVCIEGQPRTSARILLNQLQAAGIELKYHGDFDWAGIRIANLCMERHGATPWRMDVESYLQVEGGVDLDGPSVAASWEGGLEAAMLATGRALHEEQVIGLLLADLRR